MESITQTCIDILEERFWRSFGGDPMRIAVCHFIQDLSSGGFPLLDAVVDRWLKALRECLASADSNVQQSAISAVTALISDYFRHQPVEKLTALLNHFLPEVTSNNQQARVGNALALGSMPRDPPHRFFAESHPTVVHLRSHHRQDSPMGRISKKCSDSSFARLHNRWDRPIQPRWVGLIK
ncbi:hypothetical protein DAPPUDRAFT_274225 [Daphnia pulex]|uniref:Uncharacterized protein n=1 Tax=Daphnia pulex TaxID=6669 RepID=E9I3Z7_DAPPU|nr:hypothetical protein DAPPUDRAFT_274225 [Daphnia pulex]|eukprot:EFX61283.1 hypothetical protein DAPPUDRAFT_274225 [Daphnia pulex]